MCTKPGMRGSNEGQYAGMPVAHIAPSVVNRLYVHSLSAGAIGWLPRPAP